jgi:hypothetical protein
MKKTVMILLALFMIVSACSKEADTTSADADKSAAEDYTFENAATSIGNGVNVRASASTDAAVVSSLNAGAKVGILDAGKEFVIVGKYYGRWMKVETEDGKTGFVLSSFIKTPGDDLEKFHVFTERFITALQKQDMKTLEKHITFPVEYGLYFEGEGEMETLEQENFFNAVLNIKPMYDITYDLDDNGDILCHYGLEAVQYTFHFRPVHGVWKLVKIIASSC